MLKNVIFIFFLMSILFILCSCSSDKNDSSQRKTEIISSVFVDSVTADFPVSFASVFHNQHQFVAYYNKNRNLSIASKLSSDTIWKYKVLPTKVGWDSHNSITMTIDRDKCIHLSGNMHNDTLLYFKSDKALDIGSLKRVLPLVNLREELRCTYPVFFKDGNNNLVFSYRIGGSGNGKTIMNIYNEDTKSFKRLTDEPLFDGLGEKSAYKSGPAKGPDGRFHTVWLWRTTPACETNHELSYARSNDLAVWETVFGEQFEVPITPNSRAFIVDPVPEKGGAINGNFSLFFNKKNTPHIAYLKYDENGFSQIYIAKPAQNHWTYHKVSDWDYRWEFSGPGSIDFHIKIENAFFSDNTIKIGYRHINNGHGELIINPLSMELMSDIQKTEGEKQQTYPAELNLAKRANEELYVRWLKKPAPEQNQFYAFRWETMEKRRFYKAPEKPVSPSPLILYKFKHTL